MVKDIFNETKEDPSYKKVVGSDYMILEFRCPVETESFQLFTEYHFITYIISGRKDWIASDKVFSVKDGDALFIRKGAYTTKQYFDVDHCIITFFFNDNFISNFIRENPYLKFSDSDQNEVAIQDQIFRIDVNPAMESLFHSVYNYLKMEPEIPGNLVEIKFKELLFNIVLNPKHKKLSQFFTSLNLVNKASLDRIMLKNFQYDLQLEEFARLSGRSLSAFKRDFQAFYKQTPGKWLKEKRLELATSLLLSSDLHVNEICYESGFKNSSHFNKAFKEKYKFPPNQFRTQRKIDNSLMLC